MLVIQLLTLLAATPGTIPTTKTLLTLPTAISSTNFTTHTSSGNLKYYVYFSSSSTTSQMNKLAAIIINDVHLTNIRFQWSFYHRVHLYLNWFKCMSRGRRPVPSRWRWQQWETASGGRWKPAALWWWFLPCHFLGICCLFLDMQCPF